MIFLYFFHNITIKKDHYFGYQVSQRMVHQYNQIMLVGHNPSITGIIGYLTPTFLEHIPTSGIVVVELPSLTWKLVQNRNGKVLWHQTPKGTPII